MVNCLKKIKDDNIKDHKDEKARNIVLKKWFENNIDKPYPTTNIKKKLALESNLSEKQVERWFKNARERGFSGIKIKYN